MFYRKLRRLKDYNISEPIIGNLKKILGEVSKERVSPLLIAKKLDVNVDLAFHICLSLVKEGLASIKYEITCPECSTDMVVVDSLRKLPKGEIICDVCGECFVPTHDDIWVVFDFFHVEEKVVGEKKKISARRGIKIKNAFDNSLFSQIIDDDLFQIDREKLKELLDAIETARSNKEKKKSLEDLAEYLFSSIYGVRVIGRNVRTETSEIDLVLEFDHWIYGIHPFFKEVGSHFMVECKNWKKPVGAQKIRNFSRDIKKRKVTFGCLISKEGITRDAYKEIRDVFIGEGQIIIILSKKDIENVIKGKNLIEILKEKYRNIKFS